MSDLEILNKLYLELAQVVSPLCRTSRDIKHDEEVGALRARVAELEAKQNAAPVQETAWLIEWAPPHHGRGAVWWRGRLGACGSWGAANDAIRFRSKADAEAVIEAVPEFGGRVPVVATEHIWLDGERVLAAREVGP